MLVATKITLKRTYKGGASSNEILTVTLSKEKKSWDEDDLSLLGGRMEGSHCESIKQLQIKLHGRGRS